MRSSKPEIRNPVLGETQATISAWAEETFGPVLSTFRLAAQANEELAGLIRAMSAQGQADAIAAEAADVAIVLYRLMHVTNQNLDDFIELYRPFTAHNYEASPPTPQRVCKLLLRFMGDLVDECIQEKPRVEWYVGQIWLLLDFTCRRHNRDLCTAIDAKMRVNRGRVWKQDGPGQGYHVREKAA